MCGIAGMFGPVFDRQALERMVLRQAHRGPDAQGLYEDPSGIAGLGHNRLSIIDLSPAGRQPMASHDRRYWIVLNGEVYNYRELRAELSGYPFRTQSDTEVILAAYERWGEACLDRFLGMFAFLLWDERERRLFGARDRFGVKPLHYAEVSGGALCFSSEIKALHAAGVPAERDPAAWATYLTEGLSDYGERTFWKGVRSVPAGHKLTWSSGTLRIAPWYSLAERAAVELDGRPDSVVAEEYGALLRDSVALRFRSDVPVAVNLSGGLDSATLLGLVHAVQGADSRIQAFTFVTGDPSYDELPWVEQMLRRTKHPSIVCRLSAEDVPALAESVAEHEDEPFGGIPTLAYARLFEIARREGVVVLLDGQGMDEQWAGYDYYRSADAERVSTVQGVSGSPLRPECLTPEFRAGATLVSIPRPFPDAVRNLQYRDIAFTKIPRALRFNDRVSMRSSTELREPFLDHRLLELALRQPADRKIRDGQSKWLVRKLTHTLLPDGVREAPKRPLQTPQREWLRGPLRSWAEDQIERALAELGGSWLDSAAVRSAWRRYAERGDDNSFYVWQWISLGMSLRTSTTAIA